MKILVAMSSPEYLRFYDDTVLELARRGHDVWLAAGMVREGKPVRFDGIVQAHPRVVVAGVIPERGDGWSTLARAVRGTMDFVRYLHPRLCDAPLLRARVKRQALPALLQGVDRVRALGAGRVERVMTRLAAIERAIPPAPALLRFLDQQAPDVLLVSPLVEPASDQVDLVRAAQARGIRVGTLVASWDNLTNKGDLRVAAGLVTVWNEAQKREAVELHRVAPATVAVTGAQAFDRWFDRQPSRARDAFCRQVGLPDDRSFVLYTGSSIFIARAEVEMPFVRAWIEALRTSADPAVRRLGVLVRPHPYNGRAWNPEVFAGMEAVAVWPRGGYDPVDEENRAGLFDSLWHASAVVGINTSAMIEAAIVGRPVFSIETPQFAGAQDGTLHYQHLLPENGGFLRVASTLDAHVEQLAAALRDPAGARRELARFVSTFVRPHGIDRPAMPVLVEAIEHFGASPAPAPSRVTTGALVLRALLRPVRGWTLLLPPSQRARRRRAKPPLTQGNVDPLVRDGMTRRARLPDPAVRVWTVGRPVVVSRPSAADAGRLATGVLATLVAARRAGAAACVLRPAAPGGDGLLALTPVDVAVMAPHGAAGLWVRAAWHASAAVRWGRSHAEATYASFWRELSRELRRAAGDEAMPDALRTRLRAMTRATLDRAAAVVDRPAPLPRRLLRERVEVRLPEGVAREAERALAALGVGFERPLVVIEDLRRPEAGGAIARYLAEEGYQVVRVGAAADARRHPGVVDVPGPIAAGGVGVFALLRARFVVCASAELQQVACLTNAPSLRLDAPDPVSGHPVRDDSFYALSEIVDLDSGRRYGRDEQLEEGFFRNLRNCGWRGTPVDQALAAVQEMHQAQRGGWQESGAQAAFRARTAAAAAALAGRVPSAVRWGADDGFLGDGRLARCQADGVL